MTLHIEVHGSAQGTPVLLSSGLGGAAGFWRPQVEALVAAGYRVIAYDQRGTGRSPASLAANHSIADMARDVIEVLDATDTARCTVVGHALGGLIGLQLALDQPARVAALVLINAWSQPNSHSARCFDARLALLGAVGPRAYVEAQPIFLYPAAWCVQHPQRVADEVEHAFTHFPGEANVRARIAALRAFDVDARLGEIDVPALVAVARDDVLVPWTCSEHLAARLRHARLVSAPYGGHGHCITEADAFNAGLLAFLAETVA